MTREQEFNQITETVFRIAIDLKAAHILYPPEAMSVEETDIGVLCGAASEMGDALDKIDEFCMAYGG